uniref:OB domain-containing protein n=1 Tax=Fagus sylvatica TaxID=28930 RepID=A0A2N9HCJ8_FAGSY
MATEQQQEQPAAEVSMPVALTRSNYSNRVLLKTILKRDDVDGGERLVGERVLIGGWVKSSKEVTKDPVLPPPQSDDVVAEKEPKVDITCVELLQSRIPFFRSIIKVFGGGHYHLHDRQKLEQVAPRPPPPPPPSIAFLQVSDGSCVATLQVIVDSSIASPRQFLPIGTCILVEGVLMEPSERGKQVIELKVEKILHIGTVEHEKYPLAKKKLPFEMLRDYSQFRSRTTTVS